MIGATLEQTLAEVLCRIERDPLRVEQHLASLSNKSSYAPVKTNNAHEDELSAVIRRIAIKLADGASSEQAQNGNGRAVAPSLSRQSTDDSSIAALKAQHEIEIQRVQARHDEETRWDHHQLTRAGWS